MNNAPCNTMDIFLQPGELYFGDRQTRIRTLLGSCVAMVFWHPGLLVGGMCHFMLPTAGRRGPQQALSGRYADDAMELLMQQMAATGAPLSEFQAKLFGGGDMFPKLSEPADVQIGRRNSAAAHALLQRHGFECVAEHLGGRGHRNVIFDIWSGHVWIRQHQLQPALPDNISVAPGRRPVPRPAAPVAFTHGQGMNAMAVAPLCHGTPMERHR